jgi:spermidine/putrescine-binding protein
MIYTSLVPEDLAALAAAFERKYGVKLKSWRANSEKVVQRTLTEARAGRHEADAVETNGPQLEALYREKALQPLRSPHLKDLMPQALRPHGYWVGSRINLFVQSYNTRLVKKEELPKSYAELAEPRWKGASASRPRTKTGSRWSSPASARRRACGSSARSCARTAFRCARVTRCSRGSSPPARSLSRSPPTATARKR